MKLTGRAADRFCEKPDLSMAGALLHGPDEGLLALRRAELVRHVTANDEMRLSRLDHGEARKNPAAIDEALRARGFFDGRRVVLIERATDALTAALKAVLDAIAPDDAFLVVVGSGLSGRSSLRKFFEGHPRLMALGLYSNGLDATELTSRLADAGLAAGLSEDALHVLEAAIADMDAGSIHQLLEKISLYGAGRTDPLGGTELEALLPQTVDSGLDTLVAVVAQGRAAEVSRTIQRLSAAGTTPARMLIATGAHFRSLLNIALAGDGPERALLRLRPPVHRSRKEEILRQVRRWGAPRLEGAVRLLSAADRTLRSPGTRPDRAMVERTLIRLAMSGR